MLSPVTQGAPPMHGPPNQQQFQASPDRLRDSDVQGIGRSPGQQWPHMPFVEQVNFDQLAHALPSGMYPIGMDPNPDTAQGWSIPRFYEQWSNQRHVWPVPIAIKDPRTRSYTSLAAVGEYVAPDPAAFG